MCAQALIKHAEDTHTRDRILAAAEQLFARHGYGGTSLRAIMGQAQVNTASVHYHFGGKEALLRAVVQMRVEETNTLREQLLDQCEQAAGKRAPKLRDLLYAFFGPAIRLSRTPGGEDFNQISALCSVDPDPAVRLIVHQAYERVAQRFIALLQKAVPQLDGATLYWRLNCMYGSMMYVRTQNGRVDQLIGAKHRALEAEEILEELVTFVEAGFLAPIKKAKKQDKPARVRK
jgi:AcrR family transcriptional regulator